MKKVESGNISLVTLSDIIRVSLLYKWGGGWLDSTVLLVKEIDLSIFNYPFYTRNIPEKQYCTNTVWADWFMFGQAGSELFRFVMEAFFYYFKHYEKIIDYFLIDYLIAIAFNQFENTRNEMLNVPFSNEKALELSRHLDEKYTEKKFSYYTEKCCVQKLSNKNSYDVMEEKSFINFICSR